MPHLQHYPHFPVLQGRETFPPRPLLMHLSPLLDDDMLPMVVGKAHHRVFTTRCRLLCLYLRWTEYAGIDGNIVDGAGKEMRWRASREIKAAPNAEVRCCGRGAQRTRQWRLSAIDIESDRRAIPRHHDTIPMARRGEGVNTINPADAGEVGYQLGTDSSLRPSGNAKANPATLGSVHHGHSSGLRQHCRI